ncbi:GntR family transcriptional regulator [Ornithinibacillus sp. 4-3]|uniref:GntR family transcriptional regulator n=1 Tax=Ornithinibacillus sp. 4-3 TaxID=3231488 RepID=A0AB39HSJ5_9BACI
MTYKRLKSAILSNELNSYQYYTEEEFAEVLGVSRTPVREAIQGLVYERLLVSVPRKGVIIRKFSESEIDEIFLLREAVESIVLEKFMKTVTNDQINNLKEIVLKQKEAIDQNSKKLFIQFDQKFHNSILQHTNYELIGEFYKELHDLTVVIGHQAIREDGRMDRVIKEHETIIAAIEKGDVENAKNSMLTHLQNTMESYKRIGEKMEGLY